MIKDSDGKNLKSVACCYFSKVAVHFLIHRTCPNAAIAHSLDDSFFLSDANNKKLVETREHKAKQFSSCIQSLIIILNLAPEGPLMKAH